MSSDTQFTALGPTAIGFQTRGANIQNGGVISGTSFGVRGSCGSGFGEQGAGIEGTTEAFNSTGVVGLADNGSNAYGIWGLSRNGFAGNFDGRVRINGNLEVTGAKAAVVPLSDGSRHYLYAVESPESWFEDFGFGRLTDGYAEIQLDSDFAAVVTDAPYHVFITEYEDSNALYVTARTSSGFEVRAKTPGASSQFSYRIVAKRKDITAPRFEKVEEIAGKKFRRDEEYTVPGNDG